MKCYICDREFEPDPQQLKAWAESECDFDPTDWECGDCQRMEAQLDEVAGPSQG